MPRHSRRGSRRAAPYRPLHRHSSAESQPHLHWILPLALLLSFCIIYFSKLLHLSQQTHINSNDDYFPFLVIFAPVVFVVLFSTCMICFAYKMSKASKNFQNILSEMPDDPVFCGPNGEMVTIPYVEERLKSSFGICWCFIKGYAPRVHGLPQGVVPLSLSEKKELLDRLAGNWKIQLLPGGTSTAHMVTYEDVFISGDKIVISGGVYNAYSGTGSRSHLTARANETQESRIVPFRDKGSDGVLYLDQIGSKLVRESADGGELELDSALGVTLLLQREWKRQGHALPPSTPTDTMDQFVPVAYPVAASRSPSSGNRDIGKEIMQLKELHNQGALTEQEFSNTKAKLLKQWTERNA